MADGRRETAMRLGARYATGLAAAQVTGGAAVILMIASLSRNTVGDARQLITTENLIATIVLVVIAAMVDAVAGVVNMLPTFRWFADGEKPTPAQQRAATRIPARQTTVHFGIWVVSGAVLMLLNLDAGGRVGYLIGAAILLGGATTACMGYLVTQRALRPIIAAAMEATTAKIEIPGVLARLIIIWALFSALPIAGIALIVLARATGWFVQESASVELPILVLAATSLLFGAGSMVLVARSISDPVGEVVIAMEDVEHGRPGVSVDVYEPSEIGRLQSGFNRMVAGLAERERLRELFGRYVGVDVARHAMERDGSLRGDVREVAVLFVDLVGSTTIAATRPPQEVARILNDFFRIVVAAVEHRQGLINKFEGDAVLAVFGAPLRIEDPVSAALATARTLATELRTLGIDFGIGVSCGPTFAGTIGAENRYEYTVVGDAVNEAARLADRAKDCESRVLASGTAIGSADDEEQRQWISRGSAVLRGRSTETDLAEPILGD